MFDRSGSSGGVHLLIEPKVAQAAFERVAPRLHALGRDELLVVRGDVQVAAAFAFAAARASAEPCLRGRLAKLGATGEYDGGCAAELGDVALAAWYTRHRCLLAGEGRAPLIPVRLLDEALGLRRRLLDLVEEQLLEAGDAADGSGGLEMGASCEDVAGDLVVLSTVCARYAGTLPEHERWYHEGEALRAREVAEDLFVRASGASAADPDVWGVLVRRAWTLLVRTYEEVRRGGRFLFRDGEGERRFPALHEVARLRPRAVGLADVYLANHASPAA